MRYAWKFIIIATCILLWRCTINETPVEEPIAPPPVPSAPCFAPGTYQAVDLAEPTDTKFLYLMRQHRVETIIRYYDWEKESIKGKTPKAEELKLIKDAPLQFLAVFQHYNSSFSTFQDPSRPAADLKRILELAKAWGQPKGSGVYIGVDGDFWTTEQKSVVRNYFRPISEGLRKAGFKVGMYGSGANCLSLAAAGLIDKTEDKPWCWIAGSSGWSMTKDVLASGKYVLKQRVNQKCGGKSLDYNTVNAAEYGAWSIP